VARGLTPEQLLPGEHNTMHWQWYKWLKTPSLWVHRADPTDAGNLLQALESMAKEPVVFVPKLFSVSGTLPEWVRARRRAVLDQLDHECPQLAER
jgi:hypothetical protein